MLKSVLIHCSTCDNLPATQDHTSRALLPRRKRRPRAAFVVSDVVAPRSGTRPQARRRGSCRLKASWRRLWSRMMSEAVCDRRVTKRAGSDCSGPPFDARVQRRLRCDAQRRSWPRSNAANGACGQLLHNTHSLGRGEQRRHFADYFKGRRRYGVQSRRFVVVSACVFIYLFFSLAPPPDAPKPLPSPRHHGARALLPSECWDEGGGLN